MANLNHIIKPLLTPRTHIFRCKHDGQRNVLCISSTAKGNTHYNSAWTTLILTFVRRQINTSSVCVRKVKANPHLKAKLVMVDDHRL